MASFKEKIGEILNPLEEKVYALKRTKHSEVDVYVEFDYEEGYRSDDYLTYDDLDETVRSNVEGLLAKLQKDKNVTLVDHYDDDFNGDIDDFISSSVDSTVDGDDLKTKICRLHFKICFDGGNFKKVDPLLDKFDVREYTNYVVTVDRFTFNYNEILDSIKEEENANNGEYVLSQTTFTVVGDEVDGVVKYYHKNGQLKCEVEVVNGEFFGGDFIKYHDNGQIAIIKKFPKSDEALGDISLWGLEKNEPYIGDLDYDLRIGDEYFYDNAFKNDFVEYLEYYPNGNKKTIFTEDLKGQYNEEGDTIQCININDEGNIEGVYKVCSGIYNVDVEVKDGKYVGEAHFIRKNGDGSIKSETHITLDDEFHIASGVFTSEFHKASYTLDKETKRLTYIVREKNWLKGNDEGKGISMVINDEILERLSKLLNAGSEPNDFVGRRGLSYDMTSQLEGVFFGNGSVKYDETTKSSILKADEINKKKYTLLEETQGDNFTSHYSSVKNDSGEWEETPKVLHRETTLGGWDDNRFYVDGTPKLKKHQNEKGLYVWEEYYPNGNLSEIIIKETSEGIYNNWLEIREYREDGTLREHRRFVDGEKITEEYNMEGNLIRKEEIKA